MHKESAAYSFKICADTGWESTKTHLLGHTRQSFISDGWSEYNYSFQNKR